ncbi:AAA family ATPase [Longispora urticae]
MSIPSPQNVDPAVEMNQLLASIEHSSKNVSKYRSFEAYVAGLTGLEPSAVYASYISKAGNLSVRFEQSGRARDAKLLIALVDPRQGETAGQSFEALMRLCAKKRPGTEALILQRPNELWEVTHAIVPSGLPDEPHLYQAPSLITGVHPHKYLYKPAREAPDEVSQPFFTAPEQRTDRTPPPLVLDERVLRMLRTAIASHRAVMLVGPPGTGKSTLVHQLLAQVQQSPGAIGMTMAHELMTVTPDESWTTRELVGGDSVDSDGRIGFAPGYVLQAVQEDKWLLLDEANRADLDRIFGGLMTWLTGRPVTVGRPNPSSDSEIVLGWNDDVSSTVIGKIEEPDDDTHYRAGTEWRLIGTYNSIDAHTVFRFGLALGRRFAQVPVPPPQPGLFAAFLGEHHANHDETVRARLAEVYRAHFEIPGLAMGPASFLGILDQLRSSLHTDPQAEATELFAEAYLAALGTWIRRSDETIQDELGAKLSVVEALGDQWEWVKENLRYLA